MAVPLIVTLIVPPDEYQIVPASCCGGLVTVITALPGPSCEEELTKVYVPAVIVPEKHT